MQMDASAWNKRLELDGHVYRKASGSSSIIGHSFIAEHTALPMVLSEAKHYAGLAIQA